MMELRAGRQIWAGFWAATIVFIPHFWVQGTNQGAVIFTLPTAVYNSQAAEA